MRILTNYLRREIYASVALVSFALLALFMFMEMLQEMKDVGEGGYHWGYMLLYLALSSPMMLYELLPVAVLIGTIFALVQMASHSELTIYRASGVTVKQMMQALFKIALPLMILGILLGEFIAPHAQQWGQRLQLYAQNQQTTVADFRSGVWLKDGLHFINIKQINKGSELQNIEIFSFDEQAQLKSITRAQKAQFSSAGNWQLEQIETTHFSGSSIHIEKSANQNWHSSITPKILGVLTIDAEQMSAYDLYLYTQHLVENKQKSASYRIVMWNKLIYPITLFVMMLLALPFASRHQRSGGVSKMVFTGIVLGLAFHFSRQLATNLGSLNDWSPILTSGCIPLLFTLLGIYLLWQSERR